MHNSGIFKIQVIGKPKKKYRYVKMKKYRLGGKSSEDKKRSASIH